MPYEQPATLTLDDKAAAGILTQDEQRWAVLVEQSRHKALVDQQTQVEDIRMQGREAAKRLAAERLAIERGHVSSRILTYAETCALKPPAPLVPNVVYTGAVAVILGDSQVGKSWVMLSVAAAAATGIAWPTGGKDAETRPPMPVLYVAAEDGGTVASRLQQWERAHGRQLGAEGVTFHIHPGAIDLLDDIQIDELCETVAERGYLFVVFDTIAASLGGEEEGNPQFSRVVQNMRRVLQATHGAGAVFLVHHFGKDKSRGARGGSSLYNDSDVFWELHGSRDAMVMKNTKWKTGKERYPWRLRLDESDEQTVCVKADTSAASVSVGAPENKFATLATKIVQVVTSKGYLNQGRGPTRNVIVDTMRRELNYTFNDRDVAPCLDNMIANRELCKHEGSNRARFYALPPVQTAMEFPDE